MIELDAIAAGPDLAVPHIHGNVQVREGEHVVICGHSGAGKTTLLRVIAGLAPLSAGRVLIAGKLAADGTGNHLRPSARSIGVVFQDLGLWPHLNVAENVALALRERRWPNLFRTPAAVAEALDEAQLLGFEKRPIATLSGGELQRVAFARALVGQPRILLLDEPFTALDLTIRVGPSALIAKVIAGSGLTVMSVLHDPHEAVKLTPDRVVAMEAGKIAEEIPGTALLKIPARSSILKVWQARLGVPFAAT